MSYEAVVVPPAGTISGEPVVGRLAQFFPEATPVRIPVQVTGWDNSGTALNENVVIEFGTPSEVLFASTLPWEFGAQLRIENSDGSLRADAGVVAMLYQDGKTVVAARFTSKVANWIVKR